MNPLISVIVPVYNGQDYLEKCIESICGQSYQNLEIIIVDDGSTDDTPKVCDDIVCKYSVNYGDIKRSVVAVHQKDKGVSSSRNTGIDLAKGEYITFVDADDRLFPEMLQVLYNNMELAKCDVSGCGFIKWITEEEWNTNIQKHVASDEEYEVFDANRFAECIIAGNSRCWSKLYKKSGLVERKVRFAEDLTIGEDMLFLAELTKCGFSFCESEYKGYGYYQNSVGAMNRKFSLQAMDQIYCWERAREVIGASDKIDSIIIISILLTVGRIAVLSKEERSNYINEINEAHNTLKKYYSNGAIKLLDKGYKIKVAVFKSMPKLYINMYNTWKN